MLAQESSFDWRGPLENTFELVTTFVPKLLLFLVILVVGLFVAKWLRRLVHRVLTTVRFDDYIDRAGIGRPLERAGFADSGQSYGPIVTKAATIGVWLFFGLAALDQIDIGRDLVDTMTKAIFASISAILIIKFGVGGIWAARDRFWPNVYDGISGDRGSTPPPLAAAPAPEPGR